MSKTIDPAERLIESLKPTLGKLCKTIYNQYIKIIIKITYRNKHAENHANTLCKEKGESGKDKEQANTESSTEHGGNIMTDANNDPEDLKRHPMPTLSHSLLILLEYSPRSYYLGFDISISERIHAAKIKKYS